MAARTNKKRSKRTESRSASRPTTPIGRDITGIAFLVIALLSAAAIASFSPLDPPNGSSTEISNKLGTGGAIVAHIIVQYTFGRWLALIVPLLIAIAGFDLLRGRGIIALRRSFMPLAMFGVLASSTIGLFRAILEQSQLMEINGLIGWGLYTLLSSYLGVLGTGIILGGLILIYLTALFRIRWLAVADWFRQGVVYLLSLIASIKLPHREKRKPKVRTPKVVHEKKASPALLGNHLDEDPVIQEKPAPKIVNPPRLTPAPPVPSAAVDDTEEDSVPPEYIYPPSTLLEAPTDEEKVEVDEQVLRDVAHSLEQRLAEFGVQASVVAIHPGPVITRYDLKPAPGVKVSRITSLGDDLALSLSSTAVRIIAPIPGAGAVGVEVPNPSQGTVRLREIVESTEFAAASSPLAIALGKTAQGDDFVVDLAKMPHVLIAGTTGSGKSVCINTIIASILMRNRPHEVMIAMVDPKKIELSAYAELRRHHLLYLEETDEVIATEPKNAVALLQSVVQEMEKRYDRLAETGARNIVEYNRYVEKGKVQPDEEGNEPTPLPYIVMIVDELADLMLTAAREVEEPIARLAQMARAVGIHLVVATQRPSVDVITGVIKANFPARIAFMVATKIDSRTILDRPGAEALLGRGDGLFLAGTSPQPIRFHCAFVSTDEVHSLIAHVHNQPMFVKPVTLSLPDSPNGGGGGGGDFEEERDQLFEEAVRIVARHQQGSVSLLQRRLKIGYSRAGRLLDQLEQAGVVGPFEGSKAREVLIDPEQVDAFFTSGYSEDEP